MLKREETVIATKEITNEYGVAIKHEVIRVDKVFTGGKREKEEFIWYTQIGDSFKTINYACKNEKTMRKAMQGFFA